MEDNDTPETLQKRVMELAEWGILAKAIHIIANNQIEVINNIVKKVTKA